MLMEMKEPGRLKVEITVQRTPHDFVQMMNCLDPFVHERPVWQNRIITRAMFAMMK